MKVSVLGHLTFSHQLAVELFPDAEIQPLDSTDAVVASILGRSADRGIMPLFNTYARTTGVPVRYRQLLEEPIYALDVVGKYIPLCLAAVDGTSIESVETVFLMEVLRDQVSEYLGPRGPLRNLRRLVDTGINKTTDAFDLLMDSGSDSAAVGPEPAARERGLTILESGIENPDNVTFFLILALEPPPDAGRHLVCLEIEQSYQSQATLTREVLTALAPLESLFENRKFSGEDHMFVMLELDPDSAQLLEDGVQAVLRWRDVGRRLSSGIDR